jgi:beta-phosphoglucomutase-like phosphatase (HAD superfamily)
MQTIQGILFEPVGCLAEFSPEPFLEIAARLSLPGPAGRRLAGRKKKASKSASRSYWHALNLMEASGCDAIEAAAIETIEMQAVESAAIYEDVIPALAELKAMDIRLTIASSLSSAAVGRFLERSSLLHFDGVWNRDNSGGIKAAPLRSALAGIRLEPCRVMFLTDTAEGLKVAESAGVNSILMMNDPDESRRLAMLNPAGGIVSLHELPDFIRLLRSRAQPSI